MKKRIGVLTIVLLTVAALGVMSALEGCVTTTTAPDGTKITSTDMQATAAGIQLAMTAADDALALWVKYHPQASPEEIAAKNAESAQKRAALQALLERLLAGAIEPKAATVAKTVIASP